MAHSRKTLGAKLPMQSVWVLPIISISVAINANACALCEWTFGVQVCVKVCSHRELALAASLTLTNIRQSFRCV